MPGRDDVVLKRFAQAIPGALPEFTRIVYLREAIRAALPPDRIHLCWPEEPVATGTGLAGYVMPRLSAEFYFQPPNGSGSRQVERSLDWSVTTATAFPIPFTVTGEHRLELARLIAQWLSAMHMHDLVYGDLSWKNIAFAVQPHVQVAVFDFDTTRALGSPSFNGQHAIHTIDWDDPTAGDVPPSLDNDRYRYALLAYRLLVSCDLTSGIDSHAVPPRLPGLNDLDVRALRRLFRRAAGPAGTRPTLQEWCATLGVAPAANSGSHAAGA